eukprot:gene20257-28483_t
MTGGARQGCVRGCVAACIGGYVAACIGAPLRVAMREWGWQ